MRQATYVNVSVGPDRHVLDPRSAWGGLSRNSTSCRSESGGLKAAAPLPDALSYFLRSEAEVLGDLFVWSGGAEAIDADDQRVVVDILVPAGGAAGLDGHDAAAIAEDAVLIVNILPIEHIKGWGGDHPRAFPLVLQEVRRFHRERHFGTGGHQGDVAVPVVVQHVRPAPDLMRIESAAASDRIELLPREHDQRRSFVLPAHRPSPGHGHFRGIRGAEEGHVRN